MKIVITTIVAIMLIIGSGYFYNQKSNDVTLQVDVSNKTLDLSNRGLTSIPTELFKDKSITSLDLSDNKLTGIPAEVGQLYNLRTLDLSNNPITGLPYEIGNLSRLETLDLRGTSYSKIDLDIIMKSLPTSTAILR